MIIQNLHNIYKEKKRTLILFAIFCFLFSATLNAQDSIVPQAGIDEKTSLEFQEHFFKAITEKAINNHESAVDNLQECNSLLPKNVAVLFELSKNYLLLNKPNEAVTYAEEALQIEPNNIWLLEHLVSAHRKQYQMDDAIEVQKRIVALVPKKKRQLVFLHLQNKDKDSAKRILEELAKEKMLTPRLKRIKASLDINGSSKKSKTVLATTTSEQNLELRYKKEKSFQSLKNLLTDLDQKNNIDLLKYSEEGLSLFPAQPIVYLMNGKALNKQNQYKKAIESLQNGVDFVIDDAKMENHFFNELIKAYQGLGDKKNVNKYKSKLK